MTDTITIKFEIPADLKFGTKANGEFVQINVQDAHDTWLAEALRYGFQRKVNDTFAGETGNTKLELVRDLVSQINAGEERAITMRRSGGSSVDPVTKMARGFARDLLMTAFKKSTGLAKIADMCAANEKVAQFFTAKDDKYIWNHDAVDKFMETKPAGRDFKAEAEQAIKEADAAADLLGDLDL